MHQFGRNVLALVVMLAGTEYSHAHATAGGATAKAGQPFTVLLTIPHGCSGEPTTEVAVGIPEGFLKVEAVSASGWTASTVTSQLSRTYSLQGETFTEGVVEVTWRGGSLPDGEVGIFAVKGVFADDITPGSALFPLLQLCPGGEEAWLDRDGDRAAPHVNILR